MSRALWCVTKGRAAAPEAMVAQHGRLHLQEMARVEVLADRGYDARPTLEGLHHLWVHHEVEVALPIADLGVLESVVFLGQGLEGLGEEYDSFRVHGDLASASLEHAALDADDVAAVVGLHATVLLQPELVGVDVDLDAAVPVLEIDEGSLADVAEGHHPAGHRNVLVLEGLEGRLDLGGVMCLVEADDGEGVAALGLELGELLAPHSRLLGEIALQRRLVELFARRNLGTRSLAM